MDWTAAWLASALEEVEADGARLRALGPDAMADGLLGILRHQALEFGLGLFVLEMRRPGPRKHPANSAQALEALISTMRTASMRGFGGSTPNRRRGLAALDTAPELPLRRDNQVLIERIGIGR